MANAELAQQYIGRIDTDGNTLTGKIEVEVLQEIDDSTKEVSKDTILLDPATGKRVIVKVSGPLRRETFKVRENKEFPDF